MSKRKRAIAAAAEQARLVREQGGIRWRPEAVRSLRAADKRERPPRPVERDRSGRSESA